MGLKSGFSISFSPASLQQLDHALGDGRGGGQAGRFDPAQVDQAGDFLGDLDHEVVVIVDTGRLAGRIAAGAQPGEDGDGMFGLQVRGSGVWRPPRSQPCRPG